MQCRLPCEEVAELTKRAAPKVSVQTPIARDVDLKRQMQRDREGRPVDDAYVERLIGASRKPGRPSLAEGGPSPSIAFRVPTAVRERAEAVALREGKTVSQLAREALEARLAAS
jgi:hypothetical protein